LKELYNPPIVIIRWLCECNLSYASLSALPRILNFQKLIIVINLGYHQHNWKLHKFQLFDNNMPDSWRYYLF